MAIQLPPIPGQAQRVTSYGHDKEKIQTRLRRVEGQVRGIQRMVNDDTYCVDVLTQISAAISALRTTGMLVLEDHVRGCVVGTCRHGHEDKDEMVTELMEAIGRFTKSVN